LAEESTSLNFDANIIVSGVRVSPNVRNTLAAISDLSQSKPVNQTVNVRYNVEQIDAVTKQGSELASNLKEIFGKTQLTPNVVFNTKEIIAATSRLEQVKSALSTIGALMKAIQGNRFAIPNSGEELGRLAVLQRTLSSLKQQAEKGVKFQFSAPLTEVRALDARIIGANTNVEQLKRSLAELGKEKVKVEVQVAEKKPQLVAEQEKLRKAIEKRKSKEQDVQPRIEEERNRVKQLEDELERTRAKLGGVVKTPRGSEEAIKIKSAKLQEAKVERVRVKDLLDQQISASDERIDAQKKLVKQEQDALDAISKEATSRARKRLLDENDKAGKDFRAKNKTLLDRLAQEEKIASDRETELKTVSKAREQAQIDALARQAKAELELENRKAKFEETNPLKKGQRVNLAERRRELLQFTETQRKELEIANVDVARIEKATPEGIAKLEAEKAAAEQEFNKASKTLQDRQRLIGKNKSTEFTKILKDLNKEVDDARNRFNQISSELSAVRRFAAAPNLESLQTRTQEARAKADQTRAKLETKLEGPAKFIGSADPQVKEQEKKLRDAQKSLSKTQAQEVGTLEPYRVSVKQAQEAVTKLDDELKKLKETSKDKSLQTPQQILETIKKLESRREKTLQLIKQLERGGADQQLKAVRNQLRKKNLELKALQDELQQASSETAPVSQPIGPVLVAKTTEGASANELAKARAAAEEQLFQARLEVAQKSLTLEQRRSGAAKVGREGILETKQARETLREPVQVAARAAETEKAAKNRLDLSRSIRESTISTLTKELRSADDDLRNILKNFKVTKSLELGLQDAKDQFVEARKTFQKELAKLDKTDVNFDALKKSLFESTVGSAKKALEAVKAEYKAARELAVRPLATRRGELSTQLRTEEAKTGSDVREAEAEYRAAQLNTLEQKRQVELSRQALLLRVGLKKETEAVSSAAGRVRKAQDEYNAALKQQESVEDRIAKANSENAAQLENIKNTQAAVNAELAKTIALREAEKAALASTRAANDAAVKDKKKSLQTDKASLLAKKAEIDTILAGVEDTKLRARIEKNLNRVIASRSAFVANEEKRTQFSAQREAEKSVRRSELERLEPQAAALRTQFEQEKKVLKEAARERTLALEDEYKNLGKLAAGITIKRPERRTKEEKSVISRRAAIEKEKGQIASDLQEEIGLLDSGKKLSKLDDDISRLKLELTALKSVERVTKQLGLDEAIKKAENLDKQLKKGLITKQQRDQGLIDIFSSGEDSTKLTKDEQKLLAQQRLELARIVVAEKEINAEIKAANDALRTSIRGRKELNSILTVQREINGLIVSTAKQEQEVAVASATAKADVGRRNKVIIDQAEQLVKLEQRSAALAKERARLERVPKIFGPDLPARGVFGTTLRKEADQRIRGAGETLKKEQAELEARTARLNELRNKALSGETLGAAERKEIASIVEDLSRATANLAATESKGAASIAAAEQNLKKAVAERIALQEKLNTNETTKKNLETNKTQLEARLKALKAEIAEIEQTRTGLMSTSSKAAGVAKPLVAAKRIKEELANLDQQLLQIEERRASINNEIARQQEIESRLIAEQAEKAKQVTVEENKRFGIAQKLNKIIDSNIEKESAFQRRQATAFEKRGEFYTKPDSRAKTLERLGITEAEATAPTEDVLARARAARPGAARQQELFANIDKFSKEDRSELVRKNLQKVLDVQEKIAKARAKTSVLDSEGLAKETEARLKESLKRVFGQDITLPEVQILVDAGSAAEVVRILKSITNELDLQKKALKDQVQVNQEVISLEKARKQVADLIEAAIRAEGKLRAKLKTDLAGQGISYNPATGMARNIGEQGNLGPEYVPEGTRAGSLREAAISRIGITEAEAAEPDQATLEKLRRGAAPVRDQRADELLTVKQAGAIEQLNKQTLLDTQKIIKNEIDLRRRKLALQISSLTTEREAAKERLSIAVSKGDQDGIRKGQAEVAKLSTQIRELAKPLDVAAIKTAVLNRLFGEEITTIEQLIAKLAALDAAQAGSASSRVSTANKEQIAALKEQASIEAENERRAQQSARKRQKDTDSINKSIERTIDLYEKQIRTSNNLARTGARDLSGNRIPTITVDREALRAKVTRDLTGGVDLSKATDAQLAALSKSASAGVKERERLLVQFNDDVKAASRGAVSGFEIIAKYGDSAFTRLGGRIGFATEKLVAYAFSGGALYTVIGATRQAIVETALLEKEITNIQQIFSSSTSAEAYGESFDKSLGSAINTAKNVKDLVLDISEVTGQSSIELAKAAKTLAAAGFGQGRPGFESTIRAVSFASLGPSFGNVEEIIDGLIASVNQFNRELTETPYILGLVNEYSKAYAVEAQDLFEAIKRGGGSFASVGGSLEDFLKLVTVARERTREAAPVIGTFLKTLSSRLFAPRTDKLLGELGLDPNTLLDPYERLLAISREISREGIGGGASVTILSELVDSRQTGRLYALLDALDEFDAKSKDLTGSATDSIVRDAQQRLDDIGPAIDRIKQSYFRFIEGIYNNPATKALITIPGGLLNLLSKIPSLGGGIGGNIAAPAVQTLGAIGITGLIKAQIAASKENRAAAAQNSENLRNLRVAIEKLAAEINANTSSTNANTQAENTNTQAENSNTAATSKQTAAAISSGGTFSGAIGGKRGFYTALALGTLAPALANSVAPMVTSDQRALGYTSSIAGGVGIGAAVGSLFPGVGTLVGAGVGGLLGLVSQIAENTAQDEQLEELRRQTKLAEDAQAIQKIISTGQIPKNQVSARLATADAESFARRLSDLQTIERVVGGERRAEIAGYSPEEFINDLLNPDTAFQAEAKKKREASFKQFFEGDENRIKEAESAVGAIQDTLRTAIINVFLREAKGIGQDTVEARQKIIDEVSKQLSEKLNVEGIKINPEQIQKVLSIFTDIDPATKNLTQGLQTLKLSIRSLYDEAEIAGKILGSLTAELTRSIQTQNIGLQRLFDQVKRSVGSIETAKDILASPFKGVSIRPLDQNATSETAARTIESITGQNVQRISSPETTRLLGVLEGFFDEFSRASIQDRQSIIRALDDERLKAIGGVEEQDTEAAGAMVNLSDRARSLRDQIELAIAPLENIGPASRELFKIISSAGTGLAIDIRELQKAIVAPDANAAERVLGLENARRALIEQANLLIEQQNYSLQQQLQAQEALVSAIEARKRAEIERTDTFIDNASKIVSLQSGAGLNNPAAAAEQTISARFAANRALFPPITDVNVAVDAITIAKELRLELGRALERVGSVQTVSERGQPVASPRFEVENARASTKAVIRVLNSLGLSDREDTKGLIEQIQTATKSGLIQNTSTIQSTTSAGIEELLQSLKNSLTPEGSQLGTSTQLFLLQLQDLENALQKRSNEESPTTRSATDVRIAYDFTLQSATRSLQAAQETLASISAPGYGPTNNMTPQEVEQDILGASRNVQEREARLGLVKEIGSIIAREDEMRSVVEAVRNGNVLDKQSLGVFQRILTLLGQKNIKIDDARLISVLQAIQTSTEQISPSVEKAVNRRDVIVPKDTASAAQAQILATIQKSLEGQASSVSLLPNTVADLFAGVKFDPTKGLQQGLREYAKLVSDTFNRLKPDLDPSVTLDQFTAALREASFVDEATVGTATGQQVGAVGAADTASVQARVQQFIDKFRQLGQASLTRPFDDLASTIASLSFDQATLESSLKLSIDGSKQLFKIFEDNTNRLSQKLQNQKGLIDSLFGKIYGGSPQDQAIQKANVQRAAQQANRLAGAIANQIPNAQQLGTTQIMQNPQIAQIVQRVVKTLPTGDVGSLVDFLKTVNQNTFLASGLTGEQLSAAITGAFANEFAKLTGVDISQGSITQTSNQLDANLQALQTVNSTILQSQQALEKVMSVNLNLLQDETSKLTKALSSIPNEINVVIKGIENINVDFDMSNVNNSIKTVGTAVFGQIVNYLKNAFQRSGVPIEFGEGEFTLNQGESK